MSPGQVINKATVSNAPEQVLGNLKNPVVSKYVETTGDGKFDDNGKNVQKKDVVTYKVDTGTIPYATTSGQIVITDPILKGLTLGKRTPESSGAETFVYNHVVKYLDSGGTTHTLGTDKYSISGSSAAGTEGKDDASSTKFVVTINTDLAENVRA